MCADIYTKAFTDALLWVQVRDLIDIVDLKRLSGLMQHVAEVVAGIDVVIVIPTKSSGHGTGASDTTGSATGIKAPPQRGGVPQNIGASDSTGSAK
eukprot:10280469-Heterocapsa_arctica.AAC.1